MLDLGKKRGQNLSSEKISQYLHPPKQQEEEPPEANKNPLPENIERESSRHWQAPEFEKSQWSRKWYLIATLLLTAIIIHALVTNSPVVAITFVLIGILSYIYLQKDPRVLNFYITPEGVIAGDEIYEFKNIRSFWIFYEPQGIKAVSLHTRGRFLPFIHIPIGSEDPVKIREILLKFIPEVEQEPGLIDGIERLLRI